MIEVKTSVNGDTRKTSVKIEGTIADLLVDTDRILSAIYEAISKDNAKDAELYAHVVEKAVVYTCFKKDADKVIKEVADGLMG